MWIYFFFNHLPVPDSYLFFVAYTHEITNNHTCLYLKKKKIPIWSYTVVHKDGHLMFHRFNKICCVKNYFSLPSESLHNMHCILQLFFLSVFIGTQQTNFIGVDDYHESNLALYYHQYLFAIISQIYQLNIQYIVQRKS